ncbi:hypothetical protein AX17_000937 [Amanita inopinata Kibby_2008]|nr:hypothetical protein AX17_000937 [Amanita inopinata Kibby_2008]
MQNNLHASVAEAAARRMQESAPQTSPAQMLRDHERRQTFRRLIDPGIVRPNSKEQATSSLNTLLEIAENLIREPNNPKFRQFKPTNLRIKRELIDPKGTLEYAIELGFRPQVRDFQPYYVHNPRYVEDLHVGAAILKEFIDLEAMKAERAVQAKKEEKAVAEAAALKVKMAFMDDRLTKSLRDQQERERRAASATHARSPSVTSASPRSLSPDEQLPSVGHVLTHNPPNDSSSP